MENLLRQQKMLRPQLHLKHQFNYIKKDTLMIIYKFVVIVI